MKDYAIIFAPTEKGPELTIAIGAVHYDQKAFGISTASEYQLTASGRLAGLLRFGDNKKNFEYEGNLPGHVIEHVVRYIRDFRESA